GERPRCWRLPGDTWWAPRTRAIGPTIAIHGKCRARLSHPPRPAELMGVSPWTAAAPACMATKPDVCDVLPLSQRLDSCLGHVRYSANAKPNPELRNGEGFRVPAGVRKPPMLEPAGHSRWLWGFRAAADVGDGATAAGMRRDGSGEAASL